MAKNKFIGNCFCGQKGVVEAFDEVFCQKHCDELAESFHIVDKDRDLIEDTPEL